ncbi:hypothetical protein GCM10007304_17540 [Rhodococcoides trifolii]|uniref:Glycoside hydrolase family 5 domain-containing protein n=1 Tax=Rhodococcoides trifolii TaxID=908250 RepID=A0A917CZW8_9NOCA|nr:cellulase family glycosylhydrolase [Rhodococcus trifolii]GGG03882.1 hypothetical protein GCM10007304_17540 [Rhodococcus trifolii]
MPLAVGSATPSAVYQGAQPVTAIYQGSALVWSAASADPWANTPLGVTAVTLSTAPTDGNTIAQNRAADFQQLSDLGIKHLRVLVQWPDTEYNQGSYDWTTTDTYVNGAYAKGINILACVTYAPGWAQGTQGQGGAHGAPNNLTAWTNFVTAAADRYADKISHWEIWNEENIQPSWYPTPSAAAYKPYLQAAFTALKAENPNNVVITGGTAPTLTSGPQISPPKFMTDLYAAGGKPYFDAVAFHPYDVPYQLSAPSSDQWRSQQHITGIRDAMVANGDSAKKMWFTEFGASTPTPPGDYGVSESQQSVLLADGIDYMRSLSYCGPIFIFDFRDTHTGTSNDQENYGIYRTNRTAKPAAAQVLQRTT